MRYSALILPLWVSGAILLALPSSVSALQPMPIAGEAGPCVEPNGWSSVATGGEIGPYGDPNGRVVASTRGEVGPMVEPDGWLVSTTGGDIGPFVEPDGRSSTIV